MIIAYDECTGDKFHLENDEQIADFRETFDVASAWMWDEMVDLTKQIKELEEKLRHYEAMTSITIER